MTLRVPTSKVSNVGMRKLSAPSMVQEACRTLSHPLSFQQVAIPPKHKNTKLR